MKLENNNTKIKFSTKELFMGLDCSDSIYLEDFTIVESNKNFLEHSKNEILRIKVENHIIPSNSLYIEDIKKVINEDIQVIYVLFQQSFKKDLFRGRISIIQKRNNPVEFIVQLSVNWHNDVPKKVLLQFPFLIDLSKNNSFLKPGEIHDIDYPSKRCLWNFHESPPATLTDSSFGHSIGIQFRDEFPWQANYNLGISEAIKETNFELYETEVQPTNTFSDIFVMRLYFSPFGRSGIFKLWKEDTRSRYDLRDYKIPESSWSQKSYLQHFTFAYGKEAFNYDNKKEHILNSVNINIEGGKMTSLVGHSGAGKSTILNLIPRFYDSVSGDILIDGSSIYKTKISSLRKNISLVSQDITLFDDTIKNNIAYAKQNVKEQEIFEAAKLSFAVEFINKLPDKYDTIIGENGVRLSGGEKQRLSIARAMLKDSKIILLDEATSSLDAETENKIQKAINFLTKDRTTLVIAHRLSTILNSDRIYVVDNGSIVDEGNHDDLIKNSKIYKNFYEKQLRKD